MNTRIFAGIIIIVCLGIMGVEADMTVVPPGGTIFIGEEQVDISASGIRPGSQIAWWAPGTSIEETPSDIFTISNPSGFSALSSSFSGREGIWYSLADKTPVLKIKQPKLSIRITDTTSDFDATGKWFPRGHLASFQIETNLYEIGNRGNAGGVPIDIIIKSPQGSEYSAVSGPGGSFSLTGIPVHSSFFDTGPVWNTGDADSGTYQIRAECTANQVNDNNPEPGAAVSQTITVLIQGVNPLIKGRNESVEVGLGSSADSTPWEEVSAPSSSMSAPVPAQTQIKTESTQTIGTLPPVNQTIVPVPLTPVTTLTPIQQPAIPLQKTPAPAEPSPVGTATTPFSGFVAVIAIMCVIIRISR